MDAVVLAGGRSHEGLRLYSREDNKALIRLGNHRMAEYVLRALRGCPEISSILLVGPPEAAGQEADAVVPGGETLLDNINAGLSFFADRERLLFVTADIPLLCPEALTDFLRAALKEEADIVYPIVGRPDLQQAFPGSKRTYVRLREGSFSGGNLMLLRSSFLRRNQELVKQVFQLRKKPWRLAWRLGPLLLLRLMAGRASLADAERAVQKLIGGRAKALVCRHAGIAFDVDKPEDLQVVQDSPLAVWNRQQA